MQQWKEIYLHNFCLKPGLLLAQALWHSLLAPFFFFTITFQSFSPSSSYHKNCVRDKVIEKGRRGGKDEKKEKKKRAGLLSPFRIAQVIYAVTELLLLLGPVHMDVTFSMIWFLSWTATTWDYSHWKYIEKIISMKLSELENERKRI